MDKASNNATKDPRRVEQGKKLYEICMKRLKEKILEDNQSPTSSTSSATCDPHLPLVTPHILHLPTCDSTSSTSSHTTRSNDTYVYGVGKLTVLPIVVCVFFAYNTSQAKNKKQANDHPAAQLNEQKKDQPSKRRPML